jgi:hypothetical protein
MSHLNDGFSRRCLRHLLLATRELNGSHGNGHFWHHLVDIVMVVQVCVLQVKREQALVVRLRKVVGRRLLMVRVGVAARYELDLLLRVFLLVIDDHHRVDRVG